MKSWLFLLLFPLLLNAEMTWQADTSKPFALSIKLSDQQVALDVSLNLEVDFQFPSSYQLKADTLRDQLAWSANPLAPSFSVDQWSLSPLEAKQDLQKQRLQATLTPLTTGSLVLSLLTVSFLPKDESLPPVRILTPVFHIQVLPPTISSASLPPAPLIPLEPQFPLGLTEANRQFLLDNSERWEKEKSHMQRILEEHTFPWLTLAILMGCGGIGWAAYLTRERWSKPLLKPAPSPSVKQQIHQAVKTLQARPWLEQGLIQNYYAELSSIFLVALQARLGWKTKEMTTAEIAQALKEEPTLSSPQKKDIVLFLTEMDQVKFAGKKPSAESARQLFQQVHDFVQQLNLS
jgi:hypothetical protein